MSFTINESYSYWTFGDIFEEQGVPFTPFHGGFGLVANGCIPKPTFWTFKFYKDLCGECVLRTEDMVVLSTGDGGYQGIVWNAGRKRTDRELEVTIEFPADKRQEYLLITKTVDEDTCNPLRLWHGMGEPSSLNEKQKKLLRDAARPFPAYGNLKAEEENVQIKLTVREFGVVYFELSPIKTGNDRGYDYERVTQMK